MREAPYFVWRRNDGFVAASRTKPHDWVGLNGSVTSFEHLGQFDRWASAFACIEANRRGPGGERPPS